LLRRSPRELIHAAAARAAPESLRPVVFDTEGGLLLIDRYYRVAAAHRRGAKPPKVS
jgi:hypothetical protein